MRDLLFVTSQNWVDLNSSCPTPESNSGIPRLDWGGSSLAEIPHPLFPTSKGVSSPKVQGIIQVWRGHLSAYGVELAWFGEGDSEAPPPQTPRGGTGLEPRPLRPLGRVLSRAVPSGSARGGSCW